MLRFRGKLADLREAQSLPHYAPLPTLTPKRALFRCVAAWQEYKSAEDYVSVLWGPGNDILSHSAQAAHRAALAARGLAFRCLGALHPQDLSPQVWAKIQEKGESAILDILLKALHKEEI